MDLLGKQVKGPGFSIFSPWILEDRTQLGLPTLLCPLRAWKAPGPVPTPAAL